MTQENKQEPPSFRHILLLVGANILSGTLSILPIFIAYLTISNHAKHGCNLVIGIVLLCLIYLLIALTPAILFNTWWKSNKLKGEGLPVWLLTTGSILFCQAIFLIYLIAVKRIS